MATRSSSGVEKLTPPPPPKPKPKVEDVEPTPKPSGGGRSTSQTLGQYTGQKKTATTGFNSPYRVPHTATTGFNSPYMVPYTAPPPVSYPTDINIPAPAWAPIDRSAEEDLRKRIAEADAYAADPLSAPGVQDILVAMNAQLARQYNTAAGDVLGRGVTGGFAGTFAQTSADLHGQMADQRAQQTADITMDVFKQMRAEGASMTEALAAAQAAYNQVTTARGSVEAQINMSEAELKQRAYEAMLQDIMNRAMLAEQARQFDMGYDLARDEFGFRMYESDRDYALEETLGLGTLDLQRQQYELQETLGLSQLELQQQQLELERMIQTGQLELAELTAQQQYELAKMGIDLDRLQLDTTTQLTREQMEQDGYQFDQQLGFNQQSQMEQTILMLLQMGIISEEDAAEMLGYPIQPKPLSRF